MVEPCAHEPRRPRVGAHGEHEQQHGKDEKREHAECRHQLRRVRARKVLLQVVVDIAQAAAHRGGVHGR